VAVEVEFTEAEFGRCSRPRLRPEEAGFAQDHCDGSFSVQRDRQSRCSLSERGILYWQFLPQFFAWSATKDHRPCPLAFTYQLVRNVLAVCVSEDGVPAAGGGQCSSFTTNEIRLSSPAAKQMRHGGLRCAPSVSRAFFGVSRGRASRPTWHNFPILTGLPSGLKTSTA
jgi:hypothetical protein